MQCTTHFTLTLNNQEEVEAEAKEDEAHSKYMEQLYLNIFFLLIHPGLFAFRLKNFPHTSTTTSFYFILFHFILSEYEIEKF